MMKLKYPLGSHKISSPFGWRLNPFKPGTLAKVWHSGVDFPAPKGTLITPVYNGVIRFTGERGGYGLCVIMEHTNLGKVYSLYAHLSEILVKVGTLVYDMHAIGKVGNTGHSLGNHLHLEVRFPVNGVAFVHDPMKYLA